jgi:hypothetical protein
MWAADRAKKLSLFSEWNINRKKRAFIFREALIKSFDRLRTNGKCLIPFVADCMDAGFRATQEQLP